MRILLEFNTNENPTATPLLFAQAVIDYWMGTGGNDFTVQGETIKRINLRETTRHVIEYLDAEECRLDTMRRSNERRAIFE